MKKYNANQYGVCIIYDGKEFYYHSKKYNIDEIIKFYIVDTHSKVETIKHFNISDSTLVRIFKHYQIKKSRLLSHEHNKKTCQRRYGNENYNNLDKQRQTLQLKYGVNNYFQKTDYIRNSYIKN